MFYLLYYLFIVYVFIACSFCQLLSLKFKRPHTTQSRTAPPCLCWSLGSTYCTCNILDLSGPCHPRHAFGEGVHAHPTLPETKLEWFQGTQGSPPLFKQHCSLTVAVLAALAVGDLLVRFGSMFICIVSAWSRSCWTGRPGGHGWKGPSWNDYWGGFGHGKSCRCAGAGAGSDQNAPETSKDHKETMP